MSAIVPSPIQAEPVFSKTVRSKNRNLIMCIAFWHALRRDILVTARDFIPFLIQALVMPFSFLFVFGRVLPGVGFAQKMYPSIFLPGVIAVTIFMTSLQGISISLMVDLDDKREIDDRLLAPLPVSMVALCKVLYAAVRSLVAAGLTFILAYFVLGSGYQVRTDSLIPLICVLILYALSSAALGLVFGSALTPDKMYLLFSLVFSTTVYTGCVYYSWNSISSIRALQIITLFNPLTYASEGLRHFMVPAVNGQAFVTLPVGWALLGLSVSFIVFLTLGIRLFHRRVIA